jgi:hypothetical protein
MTKYEFIQMIKDELTVACALPYNLPEMEYERIIKQARNWFRSHYEEATEFRYYIIENATFKTAGFKTDRTIILPDCIMAVTDTKELKSNGSTGWGSDFSLDRMLAHELYINNSEITGDDLVMQTAYSSFVDLTKAFFLDRISYQFNEHSHKLIIKGRDPKYHVVLETYVDIQEEFLYDDWYFQRYCTAMSKISLGRMLGLFDFNLPGGVSINNDIYTSEGNDELADIKTQIDDKQPPDWFLVWH